MKDNSWARILAYVTGLINQELLLRNEYLAAENRILRAHTIAAVAARRSAEVHTRRDRQRLGRKALKDVACVAKPDTILTWYRRLMPFGFHLAMDTLPSGVLREVGFRFTLACFRLSLSCPFRFLHT